MLPEKMLQKKCHWTKGYTYKMPHGENVRQNVTKKCHVDKLSTDCHQAISIECFDFGKILFNLLGILKKSHKNVSKNTETFESLKS